MNREIVWNFYFVFASFGDEAECSVERELRSLIGAQGCLSETDNAWLLQKSTKDAVIRCAQQIEVLHPELYFGVIGQKICLGKQFESFQIMPDLIYQSGQIGDKFDIVTNQPLRDITLNIERFRYCLQELRTQTLREKLLIDRDKKRKGLTQLRLRTSPPSN